MYRLDIGSVSMSASPRAIGASCRWTTETVDSIAGDLASILLSQQFRWDKEVLQFVDRTVVSNSGGV